MFVCMYVCIYVCMGNRDIVLKLHVWIPHRKIADCTLVFSELSPVVKFWPFDKQRNEILKMPYLEKYYS